MKRRLSLAIVLFACNFANTAIAAPDQLKPPSSYDNVGGGQIWGQVFTAEAKDVLGVSWYISDPTRPEVASVNELEGPADLVLFEASNLAAPVELARTKVQDSGGVSRGLTTFFFASPVATNISNHYFIAIDTPDQFGIGVQDLFASTYSGGFAARILSGAVVGGASGRDLSFGIIASPVPEPTTWLLLSAGLMGILLIWPKKSRAASRRNDA